nr:hypothetical protein Iba_chr03bCG14410 [Ipomoea batatas]
MTLPSGNSCAPLNKQTSLPVYQTCHHGHQSGNQMPTRNMRGFLKCNFCGAEFRIGSFINIRNLNRKSEEQLSRNHLELAQKAFQFSRGSGMLSETMDYYLLHSQLILYSSMFLLWDPRKQIQTFQQNWKPNMRKYDVSVLHALFHLVSLPFPEISVIERQYQQQIFGNESESSSLVAFESHGSGRLSFMSQSTTAADWPLKRIPNRLSRDCRKRKKM